MTKQGIFGIINSLFTFIDEDFLFFSSINSVIEIERISLTSRVFFSNGGNFSWKNTKGLTLNFDTGIFILSIEVLPNKSKDVYYKINDIVEYYFNHLKYFNKEKLGIRCLGFYKTDKFTQIIYILFA